MAELYLMSISEASRLPARLCEKWFPRRFERAGKLYGRENALRSIAAGALIAGVLGVKESAISAGQWGKPYVVGGGKCFSLSHSGGYALLAVSDGDIGADIEAPGACREAAARRVFTEDERSWMSADPDRRFFELWTEKESVIKLDGRGLSLAMDGFSVSGLADGRPISVNGREIYGHTLFYEGYCISLCAYEPFAAPSLTLMSAEAALSRMTAEG